MGIDSLLKMAKEKGLVVGSEDRFRQDALTFSKAAKIMVEELENAGFTTDQAMDIYKVIIANTLLRD